MIREALEFYSFFIIADIILSYLPQFRKNKPAEFIHQVSEFTCAPVRKFLSKIIPKNVPVDFSPLAVIIGINLIRGLW